MANLENSLFEVQQETSKDKILITISNNLLAKVDSIAKENNVSRSALVSQCIEFALNHMIDDNDKEI